MSLKSMLPSDIRQKVFGGSVVNRDKLKEYFNKFMTSFVDKEEISIHNKLLLHFHNYPDKKWPKTMRRKHKKLTLSERRKMGLYSFNQRSIKYNNLLPLHVLWDNYIRGYLNLEQKQSDCQLDDFKDNNFEQMGVKLFRADYHGAELFIKRSLCPSYVGKSGIVVMETRNCFFLVGKDNVTRKIPKAACEFAFIVDKIEFSFLGKNCISRSAERSAKKIKTIHPLYL